MKTQTTKETTTQKTAAKKPAAKKTAAKKAPKGVELATIDVRNLPQLQGWKDKLTALVKENPVIEVTDKESYEDAKKRRLAIRNGRYEVQNQDKDIARVLTDLKKQANEVAAELIGIVLPTENSQDEKIKAWETKEAARLEKKRQEEEDRKNKIKDRINAIYTDFKDRLKETTFETISGIKGTLETLETMDREEFSEFEAEYLETVDRLRDQMEERIEELYASETQRKAAIAAQEAADAAKKEAAIANRNSQRMQKLAPVFSYGPAVDMGKVFEMTDTSFEEFLHTKRDSKTQADKLAKEQTDQLAEYKRKQEAAAEKEEYRIEQLKKAGFEIDVPGKYINPRTETTAKTETINALTVSEFDSFIKSESKSINEIEVTDPKTVDEEDDLTPVEKHFEQLEDEAPLTFKEGIGEIFKKEGLEVPTALKRLTQDQNRLIMFVTSISPQEAATELKSDAAKEYLKEITNELAAFKKRLLTGIEKL